MIAHVLPWLCLCVFLLAGCNIPITAAPSPTATSQPTSTPTPIDSLSVSLLYPRADTEVEMGQPVKFIVRVSDAEGQDVEGAQVTITVRDASGKNAAAISATMGHDKVYRSTAVPIPHRTAAGRWQIDIEAATADAQGRGSGSFEIKRSTSEVLMDKYGFWLDAPTLKGIVPQLVAEKGDARSGMIRWGGTLPAQHVLPENWIELHWREGNYRLNSPDAARQFLLKDVGDVGFTPVREIEPFRSTRFKQWDAWQATARGQVGAIQMEWMIFYAPEVDRTYALATTVVLPPAGIDPHATLRESFDIMPNLHAAGIASEPLLARQWPAPELLGPPLGAIFLGQAQPIVLQWRPLKELAADEYYEVRVDYNYKEGNPSATFTTRETQLALPESLYQAPNCGVFNWQVTLMRQTGVDKAGQPQGEPISYNSLYSYVRWSYPPGTTPFALLCPNEQF